MLHKQKRQPIVSINQERFMLDFLYGIFKGDRKACAAALEVHLNTLNNFVRGKAKKFATSKIESGLVNYCNEHKIDRDTFFATKKIT